MQPFSRATPRERRQYLMRRLQDLKNQRLPWLDRWRDVSDYVSPYNGRFYVNDHQETRNYDKIFDNEGGRSLNVLVSGLASGATSPVRQWFKVAVPDAKAMLDISIANWCSDVEHILQRTFQQSNTYNSLHSLYRELCLFGVGADLIMDDPKHVIRHHVLTAGEYCLQSNSNGIVDTLFREFQLTTSQAIDQFGYDSVPKIIKDEYNSSRLDQYHTFCHAIEPRRDRDVSKSDNKNMPYASYYFMSDADVNDGIISESGFKMFPVLCPRWDVLTGDTYGLSPSMVALPNIKQLQVETFYKSRGIELMIDPPVQAPASLRQDNLSLAPGSHNFTNDVANNPMRPIISGFNDISAITQDIYQLKQDIKSDFFVDLFLMVQNAQDDRKTATEIYALKEEKMLVLGSVMERLQHELLGPLVTLVYQKLKSNNLLPPPPEQIKGAELELEFQSMLAQSQRAVDINSIDRMISSVQALSATSPDIIDRINFDGLFDVYRDRLAVDPKIARSVDEANEIRQQRQAAMAQQQQSEQMSTNAASINQLMQAQKAGAAASTATQQLEQVGVGL